MAELILAHDLGTTGNKATLYDSEGSLVGSAFRAYKTAYPQAGWAEQEPEEWWSAISTSTQDLLQKTDTQAEEIAAISFSGQMMGCVALDRNAKPLRKAIIWADQRATEQTSWLKGRVSAEDVYRITGHRLGPSYSLSKILWLRDYQPDIYHSAYKFVQAKDAMVARLTGRFATDPSDASGMNLYDIQAAKWSQQMLEVSGIDPDQLPEVIASTAIAGTVLPGPADEIGLKAGTPVVIGGGDGACAAAGAGAVKPGPAYNYIGSSSWIAMASPEPIYDPDFKTVTFSHVVPSMYMPIGVMQTAGASYQWTRDQLAQPEAELAQALGISPYEAMNQEAEKSPPGANDLVYLPYLLGERSPRWNPDARGAFVGLTIRHTRADMIRAVLEGVSLNLRAILKTFLAQGATIDVMRLIGGGARGRFWNQILANVYGMPVHRLQILEEATSMGAALTGGVGIGLYPDFSMSEQMNPSIEVIEPELELQQAYTRSAQLFEATYEALVPIFDMMAE